MIEVIGVRFKSVGKIHYFSAGDELFKRGEKVIANSLRGVEMGTVIMANKEISKSEFTQAPQGIMRKATDNDMEQEVKNLEKAQQAFSTGLEQIARLKLDMKLVNVECTFDCKKILFFFTADGRIDFRELVKALAGIFFNTRIELRQIGVRDHAKKLDGMGICGRGLCCSNFLDDFKNVSTKMAKEQGVSINPTKVSGACGRLMCCLQYEQSMYEETMKTLPLIGAIVQTADGIGTVVDTSVLTGNLKVKLERKGDSVDVIRPYHASNVKTIRQSASQRE